MIVMLFLLLLLQMFLGCYSIGYNPEYARNAQDKPFFVSLGIIYPHSHFLKKIYQKAIKVGFNDIQQKNFSFYKNVRVNNLTKSMKSNPSPTVILDTLCKEFLPGNASAIVLVTESQSYGRSIASWQYFLQLAGYLGIPVIAWNADNSGLEQSAQTALGIQLAPSVHHQAAAMISILLRYQWRSFSIVTSQIAGYMDFVQAVRDEVEKFKGNPQGNRFVIIDTIVTRNMKQALYQLAESEARVILLYSTHEEADSIFKEANRRQLTGANYIWIVGQSVIDDIIENSEEFPVGMLGVYFDYSHETLTLNLKIAIEVFAKGVELFLNDTRHSPTDLNPQLSCDGQNNTDWRQGSKFHRSLKNVTISKLPHELTFNEDGERMDVELKILNLREATTNKLWVEIGQWRSWEEDGLTVNDIVWPGNEHVPPQGVPEKFHLKIAFLDEPPYINLASADPVTQKCSSNIGLECRVPAGSSSKNDGQATNTTQNMCCSGFCIDLLRKFSTELRFSYELVRVKDGNWGTLEANNKWNGLVGELQRRDTKGAEMVLTSFKINKERESAVDFTIPFLESGIAIVVAKRTGIISPTAFLEPFDTASWMLVAFVAIQVAAITIFLFEWLSPAGYNMRSGKALLREYNQMAPPRDHKFSLSRTYWLVWAVLFQAAVHVDCPRGLTARFMANMWAMFAVVFLAIYTANLAAFMITREEFHNLSGINDTRLQSPSSIKPPFRYGTVPDTNCASVLKKHHPEMWSYMKKNKYLRNSVTEGIQSIKGGELDAFIYDATVLDYLVGQDEDCQILTVGSWYAMSGYGLAFPRGSRGSKYLPLFNEKLMEYRESGYIERLQRFWLTGTCKPKKQHRRASEPLAIEQFLSAYLLLVIGIVTAVVLLAMEHVYFKYFRKLLAKKDSGGCCALVSLSMGKSLSFRGAVYEAQDKLRRHRCRDPICEMHLWRIKEELSGAKYQLRLLEKEIQSRDDDRRASIFNRTRSSSSIGNLPQPIEATINPQAADRLPQGKTYVGVGQTPMVAMFAQKRGGATSAGLANKASPPAKRGRFVPPFPYYERRHSFDSIEQDSPLEGLLR